MQTNLGCPEFSVAEEEEEEEEEMRPDCTSRHLVATAAVEEWLEVPQTMTVGTLAPHQGLHLHRTKLEAATQEVGRPRPRRRLKDPREGFLERQLEIREDMDCLELPLRRSLHVSGIFFFYSFVSVVKGLEDILVKHLVDGLGILRETNFWEVLEDEQVEVASPAQPLQRPQLA